MDKNIYKSFLILVVYLSFFKNNGQLMIMAAPTDGFMAVNLVHPNNFQLHKPCDQPAQNRYSGTTLSPFSYFYEKFWVYSTDQPFMQGSPTKPRTEMRFSGYDYTSGVWQFEGHFVVPSGTTGACIFQVFGAGNGQATTLQLRVYGGNLMIYNSQTIASSIYGKWFKLNVIHDVHWDPKRWYQSCPFWDPSVGISQSQ